MQNYATEKDLKTHLKKRVGSEFGASKELREIFGAGHFSMFGKKKASKMTLHLILKLKPMIKRREITSIRQLDEIIDEEFTTLHEVMGCPPLNIKIYKPSSKVTVSAHRGTKKAGGALAGGLLLGPVGAIAGYGLASGDGSTTKERIISNDKHLKDAHMIVYEDRLRIYDKMARPGGTILFNGVNSIVWEDMGRSFKITTNGYGTIVVSSKDTLLTYLFDELTLKLNKFQTPTICGDCGHALEEGAFFCGECGNKIQ